MKFTLTHVSDPTTGVVVGVTRNAEETARLAWDDTHKGLAILEALTPGQACVDDDGDTWVRIE